MNPLNILAAEFLASVKLAQDSEEYGATEISRALIQNLKQVHHQIKNSGLLSNSETSEYGEAALHKILGAIRDLEATL